MAGFGGAGESFAQRFGGDDWGGFRSDVSGYITGIRFYKGLGNNGTHIGLLYTAGGTLLSQATFSGETVSGWQQAAFAAPVAIAANTTYVAAYFRNSAFAYDSGYFTGTGVDNAPLHALRSGVDGLNGVYAYGGSPAFPVNSWGDTNYWVDVVFSPNPSPLRFCVRNHVQAINRIWSPPLGCRTGKMPEREVLRWEV